MNLGKEYVRLEHLTFIMYPVTQEPKKKPEVLLIYCGVVYFLASAFHTPVLN